MKRLFLFSLSIFCSGIISAQLIFLRNDSIPVNANAQNLLYPWAGGMNFCQFSDIDLNLDGIKDLFVFDRTGNRMLTFINHGTANTSDYTLDEKYAYQFPPLHDWVLLRDYNCDGKADIFTSTGTAAGIDVWENVSSVANGLQFQYVGPVVTTYFPNSSQALDSLWVTSIDLPAIRDVDGDGDLDVLTYDVAGVNVEFHRNYSKELFGTCDSLKFRLESKCWGDFAENTLNATITLNDSCSAPGLHEHHSNSAVAHDIHNGSTLECINTDGDADQDIIIGDITNPFIVYGRNGNDSLYAKMDLVDPQFPSYDVSENMNVFIGAFHLDVDNDGKKDLIFSPNAPNSENFHGSLFYKNSGANDSVVVSFVQNDFLQGNMIEVGEGAFPRFFDYDNDGDQDLFIGNYGYYASSTAYPAKISLYENQGTASAPFFKLITRDFANLFANTTNIFCPVPTFGDLDGDGDKDMIVGDAVGKLNYYRKDPGPANNFVLVQANYMGIDVGNFAAPQLVDVDRDGLIDLLIGEQSGNIDYYRNTGTIAVPNFTLITPLFGNVIVNQTNYITGYSTPFLWDSAGTYILLCGSERGYLFRYDHIDGNLSGTFTLTDSLYVSAHEGIRTCPWMADITGDSLPDLVLGNYAGGVSLFLGSTMTGWSELQQAEDAIDIYPNPSAGAFTISTTFDPKNFPLTISIFDMNGKLLRKEKMETNTQRISLEGIANGVYICTIETKSGVVVRKKLIVNG
ncbi:MAG TPA: T9SS type A sorting domain-containing protein [Bacteroidia bacterium]|jgi:hypothetical protein|nr:T9SS type A sorting domain-containing protein [Bacteroidia bacterium]